MKRSAIVILLLGAGFISDAQTMLKVNMVDNTPINISVDGRYFSKTGTSITVGDLPEGRHVLKIFAVTEGRRGRGYQDVIYEGKVKTHEGMISILQYDASSQGVQVEEQDINKYLNDHPNVAQEQKMRGQRNNNYDNGQNNEYQNNGQNNQYNNAPAAPVAAATLNDTKIDNLKSNVIAKATDSERMKVMKDGLSGETFTTDQVGKMMDWFSFESSKVDFAEWAYPYIVDKNVFGNLENKLTYQNYRDDLDRFLKSK